MIKMVETVMKKNGYKYVLVGGGYSNLRRPENDVASVCSNFEVGSFMLGELEIQPSQEHRFLSVRHAPKLHEYSLAFKHWYHVHNDVGMIPGCFLICQGWHEDFNKPLGDPLGPATVSNGVMNRNFTSGTHVSWVVGSKNVTITWAN
eukprot:COSAG02_NODE_536_length_20657_cov_91.744041_6_plen_147_part_00